MILLLFVFTLGIALLAQWHVKRTYTRHNRTRLRSGYTGAQAAYEILRRAGTHDVTITEHNEMLGDHYNPSKKQLVLSSENYHGTSAAALAVAAHECGHAIQHQQAYAPLQWRMAAVGVTNIASQLVMWIPLLGLFTGLIAPATGFLVMALGWGVIMAFNLVTLPVEFDASRRAKLVLANMGLVDGHDERRAVSQVLNAAALTYVAAFISSLLYVLYYLLPFIGGGSDDE